MRHVAASITALITAVLVMPTPSVRAVEPNPVAPEALQRAIDRACNWLVGQQQNDGSWQLQGDPSVTGLALTALANAGRGMDDPAMRKGLDCLRAQDPDSTYAVSLQTLALATLSPQADRAILERNVSWLERAQVDRGPTAGSWTYRREYAGGDNSNSHFALLALHEAALAGVSVKRETWDLARQYWLSCANPDGSWGYTLAKKPGTGSMTCAGIASLWITNEHLGTSSARADGKDSVRCCGGAAVPREIDRGLTWLSKRFSVVENPGAGGKDWLFYYLYGLERVGHLSARRVIGEADWYLEGARMLVDAQHPVTGSFGFSPRLESPVVATSFAILFLTKGRRPTIVAKSRHDPAGDWNRHGHDVAHLVHHVERQRKRDYPAGLSWSVVDTRAAGPDDLLHCPVLWISGMETFDLGPDAGARLRRYIDEGGVVFAEACCPGSQAFDRRFRQLVKEIFPEPKFKLYLLPPEHPVWCAAEIVPPECHRPLLGVDCAGRTCLIYAPPTGDRPEGALPSLSCLWELGGPARDALAPAIRREVDAALAIGFNVLAGDLKVNTDGPFLPLPRPELRFGDAAAEKELKDAWDTYDKDVAAIHAEIADFLTRKRREAAQAKNLELAIEWREVLREFEKEKQLPASHPEDEQLAIIIGVAETGFYEAMDDLERRYKETRDSLTIQEKLDEAQRVQDQSRNLFTKRRRPPK